MPRKELLALQSKRLVRQVKYVYDNVAPYRAKMIAAGIKPEDVRGVEDLQYLPFTEKTDLRDHYPFGLFARPKDEIIRLHASSGTTGKMTVVGYTKNDLEIWSEVMARSLVCAGASSKSTIHIAYGYGLFTGGLGAHDGATKLGASVVPASTGNTARQIVLIKDFDADVLCCTPSYACHIAEEMEHLGMKPQDIPLKCGVFGAEPWSDEMRKEIESKLGIVSHDIYGLSEIIGPGVSIECGVQDGLHVWEDHFIPEILDSKLKPLPYNHKGELVFTTITKEGLPLIRYRTRDICSLNADICACGRTHVRMGKLLGRTDDMLIIRGVNVFPSQIEAVLLRSGGAIAPYYQIIVDRKNNADTLELRVELSQEMFSDTIRDIENLRNRIETDLFSVLGLTATVRFVEHKSIARSEGKAVRVIDNRKI